MQDSFYYVVEYLCFFFLLFLAKKCKGLRLFDNYGVVVSFSMLIILQIGGILLFGIVPLIFHKSSSSFYHNLGSRNLPVLLTMFLAVLVIILSPVAAKKKF